MSLANFLGEETLNEHEVAWKNRDWDLVKKLADSYKEKEANEFFYILDQINTRKVRIRTNDCENYSAYAVNQFLSKHIDCSYHAYAMNLLGDNISDQMHFDYLLHSVRPGKRFNGPGDLVDPIEQMVDQVFVKVVSKFYSVSIERAKEYVEFFDLEQIRYLQKSLMSTVDEKLVKEACSYAKKADISKVLKEIEKWNK